MEALRAYLINQIEEFLIADCKDNYNAVAWGTLMQKTMNATWITLNETLPIELISRSMALAVKVGNYTCTDFL